MVEDFPIIELNLRAETPLFEQIANQLRQNIIDGVLPTGAKLPAVRELAHFWQINFNTVARAYRVLDSEGLIRSRQGQGSFVTSVPDLSLDLLQDNQTCSIVDLTNDIAAMIKKSNLDPTEVLQVLQQQFVSKAVIHQNRKIKTNRKTHNRFSAWYKIQIGPSQRPKRHFRHQVRRSITPTITDYSI